MIDILTLLSILYDLKPYTNDIIIQIPVKNTKKVVFLFLDYLETFIYATHAPIIYKRRVTEINNGGADDFYNIKIPLQNMMNILQHYKQNNIDKNFILSFHDETTICMNDNYKIPFQKLDCPQLHIPYFKHTYTTFVIKSPADLIKYSANIAILSSPCTVSIIRKSDSLYLKCVVRQEIGEFMHMFKIEYELKNVSIIPTDTIKISLKSLRIVMSSMTKTTTSKITCWLSNDGLFFKIYNIDNTYNIFVCQHIQL